MCTLSGFHKRTIFSVDWSPSGLIASGCADDASRIFAPTSPTNFTLAYEQDKAHDADVNSVAWHPTRPNVMASASDDTLIKIWEFQP